MGAAQPGRLRFGIIGCGGNMSGHVRRIIDRHAAEVEIVALVDPSGDSIERLVSRAPEIGGVPRFSSHEGMLAAVRPDAVEISTPHTLHFRHIMDSLDAGAHVLTERPMVCEVEHARRVIERAHELDRVVLVSHQKHYQPVFRYIEQQIDAGQLGEITYIAGLQ